MKLDALTSADALAAATGDPIALLPIGSIEQHAAHLPVGTDATIAHAVAASIEAQRPNSILLLPTLSYGASNHHRGFAGTVSIGTELVADIVGAALGSLHETTGVRRAVILNAHGGNVPAMRLAIEKLERAYPHLLVWGASYWDALFEQLALTAPGDRRVMGHADRYETSLMMHIRGENIISVDLVADAYQDDLPEWVHTTGRFDSRTRNGGVGDPRGASDAEGLDLLRATTIALLRTLDRMPRRAAEHQ